MPTSQDFQLQLAWLNSTGGWEFWNFLARKTYGWNISRTKTIQRDVFQTWDTDFIAGNAEFENLSIPTRETIVVRSQLLTVQQINAIARIRFAISVRDVSDDVVVIIDGRSFQYRTDAERLHQIEFQITYPNEQIQTT